MRDPPRKKNRLKVDVENLTKAYQEILQQATILQAKRDKLAVKHDLLEGMCDILGAIRSRHMGSNDGLEAEDPLQGAPAAEVPPPPDDDSSPSAEVVPTASTSELVLLQKLLDLPAVGQPSNRAESDLQGPTAAAAAAIPAAAPAVGAADSAVAAQQGLHALKDDHVCSASGIHIREDGPAAPQHDSLRLARWLFQQPPFPSAETLTMQELLADYGEMVRQLSLQLHIHKTRMCEAFSSEWEGCRPRPLEKIQAVMLRHLHLQASIMLAGKEDMIMALSITDYETSTQLPGANKELYRHAISTIGLTRQQQQRIVDGMAIFSELVQPTMQEIRQLQRMGSHSSSSYSSRSTQASGCSSCSSLPAVQSRSQLLEQEGRCGRLKLLMRKECLIRAIAVAFVIGCLSYVQMAELAVCCSPYCVGALGFASVITEEWQKQEQQEDAGGAGNSYRGLAAKQQ